MHILVMSKQMMQQEESKIIMKHIVISIRSYSKNPEKYHVKFSDNSNRIALLSVDFDDISHSQYLDFGVKYGLNLFSEDQAKQIWNFVQEHKDTELLIVHCDAGVCRSPAIAAAIAEGLGQDFTWLFDPKWYHPNEFVFDTMRNFIQREKQHDNRGGTRQ